MTVIYGIRPQHRVVGARWLLHRLETDIGKKTTSSRSAVVFFEEEFEMGPHVKVQDKWLPINRSLDVISKETGPERLRMRRRIMSVTSDAPAQLQGFLGSESRLVSATVLNR